MLDGAPAALAVELSRARTAVLAGGYPPECLVAVTFGHGRSLRAVALLTVCEGTGTAGSFGAEFGHAVGVFARDAAAAEELGRRVRRVLDHALALPTWSLGPYLDDDVAQAFGRGLGLVPDTNSVAVIRFDDRRDPRSYLSDNRKRSVRRAQDRLTREHDSCSVLVLRSEADVREWMPAMNAVRTERTAAHGVAWPVEQHLPDLREQRLLRLAAEGVLRIDVLLIENVPAAYCTTVLDGHAWRVMEGYATRRWSRYAPGRILETALVGAALATPDVTVVDWMTSAAPEALLTATGAYRTVSFAHRSSR